MISNEISSINWNYIIGCNQNSSTQDCHEKKEKVIDLLYKIALNFDKLYNSNEFNLKYLYEPHE